MASGDSEGLRPALTEHEIDAIAERLRSGELLDEHWRQRLFQEAKEAELAYSGKQSRSSILADTMAVPLQTLKRFGSDGEDGWTNKLVSGDNLQVLKTLLEMKERGELLNADGTSGVRLCYIDPPFATKREFRGSKNQPAYRDKVEGAEFVEFLRKRLVFIHELLADNGALYLHLDTNKVHYMKVLLDEIFGPQNFRTEIIWKRSSAHSDTKQGRQQHGRIHDAILFYSKGDQWVWNPIFTPYEESHIDSYYQHVEEATGRRYALGDLTAPGGASKGNPRYEFRGVTRYWRFTKKRMEELYASGEVVQAKPGAVPRQKRYLDEQPGVSLQDIWTDIGPIGAQAAEREGFPTQKPEALLERIIESGSTEGDLILDCFSGSGTTAVVAERLGRRWMAVDCGKLAVYTTQRRLLGMTEGNGKQPVLPTLRPFELCSAGLYDNALLEELPFEKYEAFVLELFGCRPDSHRLGAVPMVGIRKGGPVHLFPFNETDALMGRSYIESLHERIKAKASGEVYVIAPVSACDPSLFEDVITLDENTYFILRVPYSVIEALHGRDFDLLAQPGSFDELNDAIDSFGFDFVEPPEVKVGYATKDGKLRAEVAEFRRGGLDPDDFADLGDAGRGDLAMVMADSDYDDDVFRLREHRFGDELQKASWAFELDLTHAGERVLVIYMDTHGNERREVVEPAKLAPRKARRRAPAKSGASGDGKPGAATKRGTAKRASKAKPAAPKSRRTKTKT